METSTLFFILAGLLIAVLIGYSLWQARCEKSRIFSNTFSTRPASAPVGSQSENEIPSTLKPEGFSTQPVLSEKEMAEAYQAEQQEIAKQVREFNITLNNQASVEQAPQGNIFTQKESVSPYTQEPQVQIQPQEETLQEAVSEDSTQAINNGIVTLYVVAPEGGYFLGTQVVQKLEELGMLYGEYQIFHRHIDNANSPVRFSAANMMQPGVFDLANIENFTTVGLVLFMHLPSPDNNNVATLKTMISTAENLAQSLGGFVLDEQQKIFDDLTYQAYLQRVRQL